MADDIIIQIQETPPISISLDDGCEIGVEINNSQNAVYWGDILSKPDFDALYYPLSNPSGYITGSVVRPSDTGVFITSGQTGAFYLASNPSGFINGQVVRPDTYILRDSNSLQSINWQSRVLYNDGLYSIGWADRVLYDFFENPSLDWGAGNLHGTWTIDVDPASANDLVRLSYLTGQFYPLSNPSGFTTGIDSSLFVLKSESGAFYPRFSNPSGYVTGNVVRPSETGQFYPASNPSGFATGIDASNLVLKSETGAYTGIFYPLSANPSGYITGNNVIRTTDSYLYDDSLVRSVSWRNRQLFNSDGGIRFTWDNGSFFTKVGTSGVVLELDDQHLIDSFGTHSVSWDGRILADADGFPAVFWQNRLLMGSGWAIDTEPTGGSQIATCNYVQAYSYPSTSNPSGYVTGTVVRPADTGAFITTAQTGLFYPMSNPSGFATGVDISNLVLKSETGAYTGLFYPLSSNPSGYVTGSVVRPTQTGNFITTSQTGQFYPTSNPNGYVSNEFSIVRTNTSQEISGPKQFSSGIADALYTIVLAPNDKRLFDESAVLALDWNYRILHRADATTSLNWSSSELSDTNGVTSLNWADRSAMDSSANTSVSWENRLLYDASSSNSVAYGSRELFSSDSYPSLNWDVRQLSNSGGIVSLDWYAREIYGVWSHSGTPSSSAHIANWGSVTGYSYPLSSNPSGYITGSVVRPTETGSFITTSQTGAFYAASNPAGYVTGSVVRPTETGSFATTGWVDQYYYPRSNPSGYSAGGGGLSQQQAMAITSLRF